MAETKKAAAKPAAKASAAKTGKADSKGGAKAGAKPAAKSSGAAKGGLAALVKPSDQLAEIVGAKPLARSEVVSKVWAYIKTKKLQNPDNKREIIADAKLKPVFGKDKVTMFEMNKVISAHLTK